ncbi:hypothetical protein O3G_MSEX000356 [Manduca sexta]|nr:hypothetical protein O3G_MSEX000356 [Manduca sexta]
MSFYTNAVVIALVIIVASASTVKWVPNGSFNLPNNYKDGKLPCSKQTVVLPEVLSASVKLQSEIDVGGFVLPSEGYIILDGVVMLGDSGEENCTDGNAFYLERSTSAWNQAGAWSSSRFNAATPDSERLPCYYDKVEFPNSRYTARLPQLEQTVRVLKIGDKSYGTQSFRTWVSTEVDTEQNFVFNDYMSTGVSVRYMVCTHKFGCPCQENPIEIDCSVKYCTQPTCVAPVKPPGFCCKVCGGYITFEVDDMFNRKAFEELVDKMVSSYSSNLVYHIGFTPVKRSRTVLLVVVEEGEYTGRSAEVINDIDRSVDRDWFKGQKQAFYSGSPLSKAGMGGKIFVSVFFIVILVLSSIYLYYYKLPAVEVPFLNRGTRGMFRFQRRSDSVVSLTSRRDSTTIGGVRTAFRNPLYDSKRGRVQVAESVVEE